MTDGWELGARSPNHPLTHMWACGKKTKKNNSAHARTHTPSERENAHTSARMSTHTARVAALNLSTQPTAKQASGAAHVEPHDGHDGA